jgi:spore coat polysaccharide biosynthesis predicted glycosyltransferase SpsG
LIEVLVRRDWVVTVAHQPGSVWENSEAESFAELVLADPQTENAECVAYVRQHQVDVFYVDAIMDFRAEFIAQIQAFCPVVFYQNLSASRYLADVYILPSLPKEDAFYQGFQAKTKIFQGLKYFIGHTRLNSLPAYQLSGTEEAERVALIAGGSDPKDTLWRLYQMIAGADILSEVKFSFFYGKAYARPVSTLPVANEHIEFVPYEHGAILNCDLLVSAFGVSTYEFLALGMPVLTYGHQASNAQMADQLAEATGATYSFGKLEELVPGKFLLEIERFSQNRALRVQLSQHARQLLDLRGAERVADIIDDTLI